MFTNPRLLTIAIDLRDRHVERFPVGEGQSHLLVTVFHKPLAIRFHRRGVEFTHCQ